MKQQQKQNLDMYFDIGFGIDKKLGAIVETPLTQNQFE
jgi:hypothetical protein